MPEPPDRVPDPGPFDIKRWSKDDPIRHFEDAATFRAIRRWLDACRAWRISDGRTIDLSSLS